MNGARPGALTHIGKWIVTEVTLNTSPSLAAAYPFYVRGIHRDNGEGFAWSVPTLSDDGYDLSRVVVPARAK